MLDPGALALVWLGWSLLCLLVTAVVVLAAGCRTNKRDAGEAWTGSRARRGRCGAAGASAMPARPAGASRLHAGVPGPRDGCPHRSAMPPLI